MENDKEMRVELNQQKDPMNDNNKIRIVIISNYPFDENRRLKELSPKREPGLKRIIKNIDQKYPNKIEWERIWYGELEKEEIFNGILSCDGLILSGSTLNLSDREDRKKLEKELLLLDKLQNQNLTKIPPYILGICFGHQLMALSFKGKVELMTGERYDLEENKVHHIIFDKPFPLFPPSYTEPEKGMHIDLNHHDEVIKTSEFLERVDIYAYSKPADVLQAYKHKIYPFYAVQFHPESNVDNDLVRKDGEILITTFIDKIINRRES